MKICSKCNLLLDDSMFYKDKHHVTGYKSSCKVCCKRTYEENKTYFDNYRHTHKEKQKQYDATRIKIYDKSKKAEYDKEYRKKNKQARQEYNKSYNERNADKIAAQRREKYANDILYAESQRIRRLICLSIVNGGYTKKSKVSHILGCTYKEFIIHIEQQFVDGMSWNNRNLWHLDHIYPVSKARDESHLIELNHYTNFQPLWAEDNLKKGNKL